MRLICPLLRSRSFENNFNTLLRLSRLSTRYASTNAAEEKDIVPSDRQRINLEKPKPQLWKRPPFLKNMFLGKCDVQLLPYPEILDNKQVFELEEWVKKINKIYKEKVNPFEIEAHRKIPKDVMQEFKDLGLFGRLVPEKYGGLDLSLTQYTRLNEALSPELSIGSCLAMHEMIAVQALLLFGTEEQKQKYLPDLASGKKLAAFCAYEPGCGFDVTSVKTGISLSDDGKSFLLKGQKAWVTNADEADLFLVFAREETFHVSEKQTQDNITALLVDRNSDGIKVTPYTDTTGLLGTNCGTVEFKNTVVPITNMIGEPLTGNFISHKLREWLRFGIGTLTTGALKSLFNIITEYVINSERFTKSLSDYEMVRKKLGNIAMMIYAMESLSFYTAAIYDSSEDADLTLETAALKIFNTEGTMECLKDMMELMGCAGLSEMNQFQKFYRDAQSLSFIDASNDFARLQIGLVGCQHYGNNEATMVEKHRNPFFYPWERFKRMKGAIKLGRNNFSYTDDVAGHLHPSLTLQGNNLEECIQRLRWATEDVLVNRGARLVDVQFDPIRLANMVINLYVRTAVLSRANRSYCIGHRNSHDEYKLAEVFCDTLHLDFLDIFMDTINGTSMSYMENQRTLGGHIVDFRGYFAEHPLKHNY